MNLLKQNIDNAFDSSEIDLGLFQNFRKRISDKGYFAFLTEVSNGGFFFEESLHLYGLSKAPNFHNISFVNEFISHEYGKLSEGKTFFGQDVFGNQFAFSNEGVVMFNIETANVEFLATNFEDWLRVLSEDTDYLTGRHLLKKWNAKNKPLEFGQRLCAKKPFIIGGEYDLENLYAQYFPTYLSSNANIARQVHNAPDGTQVILKVE